MRRRNSLAIVRKLDEEKENPESQQALPVLKIEFELYNDCGGGVE